MKQKIEYVLMILLALFMMVWFLAAPFVIIVIMQDNVNAGITHPDIDVQEQIQSEMMIQ